MKKIIALLLAVVMVSALFVGCGPKAPVSTEPTGSEDTTPATGETEALESQPTETEGNDEIVELKWYTVGNGMPSNYDAWKANLDKYLEEKIGVHLDVEVIAWGDWDARRQNIVNTNQPYDIMFTNMNSYNADVTLGAFAEIGELVKTAAPELYGFIPADYWTACAVGDGIYGVPTYKDSSITAYFVWDKALADKYVPGYEDMHDLAALTEGLTAIKDGEGIAPFILDSKGLELMMGNKYDGMGAGLPALGISYTAEKPEAVAVFEQEDIMNDLKVVHDWYNAGIVNPDAPTLAEAPTYRACFVAQGWPYAAVSTWGPNMSTPEKPVEAIAIQWGNTVLSNDSVQGSMNCISASSQHPDKALQLLELVNTDPYVRDALYYGLEGENFNYVEENGIQKVERVNTDWGMAAYTQGTFFTVSMEAGTDYNQWDEVKALNAAATPSPALGFYFDTSAVADQIAACVSIYGTYRSELMTGVMDPEQGVADMMAEMRDAGFDDILAAANEQLTAWMGN